MHCNVTKMLKNNNMVLLGGSVVSQELHFQNIVKIDSKQSNTTSG